MTPPGNPNTACARRARATKRLAVVRVIPKSSIISGKTGDTEKKLRPTDKCAAKIRPAITNL
jgi:hypothetical protein